MFTTRVAVNLMKGARSFSSSTLPKVCVVGGAGGIGQPMSMLFKNSPVVGDLAVYDMVNAPGVAADLGHICAPGAVSGHGAEDLEGALTGCKAVVVPAGVPRKPGMTRDDLFNVNAGINKTIAEGIAKYCPDAFVCIISNPVNSTVPIVAETLKKAGVYDPRKLFGVTTLDVTRANTFVAESQGWNVLEQNVTVIGGHAGTTILPILSECVANGAKWSDEELKALYHRIQFGGDEVVQAKDGAGSATLSMAYAGAEFTIRLLEAAAGKQGVVECTYVDSPVAAKDGATFFATPVTLGPRGVEEIHPMPKLSAFEQETYDSMIGDLAGQVKKGVEFVANN